VPPVSALRRGAALACALLASLCPTAAAALPGAAPLPSISVDDRVDAILPIGDKVYLGGNFDLVGRSPGHGVAFDTATMQDTGLPAVGHAGTSPGRVDAVVPDGAGGWFIGGRFATVGGLPRRNLAHVTPAGAVDPGFDPAPDDEVEAMALLGDTLYIGGQFANVAGQSRSRLAAVGTDGVLTAWDPGADGTVTALAGAGSTVYVGGAFNTLSGAARAKVGAVDATTGDETTWAPQADNEVTSLEVAGGGVFATGYFTTIGGQARRYVAELAADGTGTATAWNAAVSGDSVEDLAVTGDTVYLAGSLGAVGGQDRGGAAAVDRTTGAVKNWAPAFSSGSAVAAGDGRVFVSGVRPGDVEGPAEVHPTTGVVLTPDLGFSGSIFAMALSGSRLYAAGQIDILDGVRRDSLVEIDAATGEPTAWAPNAPGSVRALAASGTRLYVGGSFATIAGQPRKSGAAFDLADGSLTAWNPDASSDITGLVVAGGAVYAAGSFNTIGGQSRRNLAALSPITGDATTWDPQVPMFGSVAEIAEDAGTLYVGGSFDTMGGAPRKSLAAFDVASGALSPWNPGTSSPFNPDAPGSVSVIDAAGDTVYVAGFFQTAGGADRPRAAALSAATGAATPWRPAPDLSIEAIAAHDGEVYVGGSFRSLDGVERTGFAVVDPVTGVPRPFDEPMPQRVTTIVPTADRLWLGGEFRFVTSDGVRQSVLALPFAPKVLEAPAVTGDARPGGTLACSDGRFSGVGVARTRRWLRDGEAIDGATGASYVVTAADVGRELVCEVTATNTVGDASASSAPLTVAKEEESRGDDSGKGGGTTTARPADSGPAPAPSPAPRRRPGLAAIGRPRVRGDRVLVTLTCAAGGPACAGKVSAHARVARARGAQRRGSRRFLIGKTRYALAPGQTRRIVVRLNRSGRALRKRRRLSAVVSVTLNRPEGGHDVVRSTRVAFSRTR
jgi:hypothetical protein